MPRIGLSLIALACICTAAGLSSACSELTQSNPAAPTASGASATGGLAVVGNGPERAHVAVQGDPGGVVYAPNGATLVRQPDGLQAGMRVPTPQPGSYNYPAGKAPGHPEVFTLWAFVFNRPDRCTPNPGCNTDDVGANTPAEGGAYNVGGHATGGGGTLNISGRIGVGQPAGAPGGGVGSPLRLPAAAEVHLALAPHGVLDPSNLPTEFRVPTGPPSLWWLAFFSAP